MAHSLTNLEIIGSTGCPYVQRSVALLAHHKIPFNLKNVDLQNKPQWLFEKSPLGKVPALVVGKDFLFESQVINEFIEDSLPADQRVQPADSFERAQNKAWIEFGSSLLGDFFGVISKATKEEFETAHTALKTKLALFEAHAPYKGPFFNGDKPSLIDFAWGPFAQRFQLADSILSVDIGDKAKNPKFSQWIQNLVSLHIVRLSILLQLQDTPGVDTNKPDSYENLDTTTVGDKLKDWYEPNLAKRFGQSYIWNNRAAQ